MPRYINVAKQLVRLYRLNLDCEDVIKEFLITAEPEEVVEKKLYDRLLENSTIIADALSKYQSADMVKVVRCKDCMYRKGSVCDYSAVWVRKNGFCQWGERNEDEQIQ